MTGINNIFQQLQDRFFDAVVSNRLVYNTCWEDPRVDRKLLEIQPGSEMVMLSSAGCNALDYLLDTPQSIHCIDANPAQNSLLELKKTLLGFGNFERLWNFFGKGHDARAAVLYQKELKPRMEETSQLFWDRHINYFSPSSSEASFYFRGTSGKIALMIHNRIKHKGLYSKVLTLLNSKSLEEQKYHFEEIEPFLWSAFYKWLMNRNMTMALLGVPVTQRNMIDDDCEGGLVSFIRSSLRTVFTERPARDNYFWRVYLTGSYSRRCCPNYLKEEHFQTLSEHRSKIHTYTCYLTEFLKKNPGSYSHFILLDHQDWMGNSHPDLLQEEWELILKNARPGARILFRSAGQSVSFLPGFIRHHIDFHPHKAASVQKEDRVGTYGSTHLGIVKS